MNSWSNYYEEFKGKLRLDWRLTISLRDNKESEKVLKGLGYVHGECETIYDVGLGEFIYASSGIEDEDGNENWIDTIDIQHAITEEWYKNFDDTGGREWITPLIKKWFGIKKEFIADFYMGDGYPFLKVTDS